MDKNELLIKLLDLKCSRTGEIIKINETVRLFDWGRERKLMGYGSYEWDEEERAIYLKPNEDMNIHYGFNDFCGIEDRYDLFRTSPEKLTNEEEEWFNNF